MRQADASLVIFGTGQIAELAWYYFAHDSAYRPVAFTVDRDYIESQTFHGLPVIPFDELPSRHGPQDVHLFVALSYAKVNAIRARKVEEARRVGYRLASYVSSKATIFPDLAVGDNCFILEDNTVQPFARIGNNVTLWSGNHIGHHAVIEDDCFISSHVVISGGVRVGRGTFIGVNSTVRDHVSIGERCVIGAGSLLLTDAADEGVYTAPASERSRVPSTRLRNI
jgi:sugar O-acyltransferase (sialic acid O-acetyltransferase NeuD family)